MIASVSCVTIHSNCPRQCSELVDGICHVLYKCGQQRRF